MLGEYRQPGNSHTTRSVHGPADRAASATDGPSKANAVSSRRSLERGPRIRSLESFVYPIIENLTAGLRRTSLALVWKPGLTSLSSGLRSRRGTPRGVE